MTAPEELLILLVDDSAEARGMYAAYFTGIGCRTEDARDGFAAFDRALKRRPDAIVMDLRMPRLDGWEAVRLLKNRPHTRDIPIVALTGDSDIEHLKLARNAGCDVVLTKPCPPDQVHAVVARLMEPASQTEP